MPEITISMAAGRTDEQKAGMMRDITQALVKNLGVDADAVVIQINDGAAASQDEGRQDLRRARGGGEEVEPSLVIPPSSSRSPGTDRHIICTQGQSWTHATSSGSG